MQIYSDNYVNLILIKLG